MIPSREVTAQEFNRQIVNQVLKEKESQPQGFDEERILDQLPQCPLHPIKFSNQKCRKCKKIKEQFEDMKRKMLHGDDFVETQPKGFDLDKAAEDYLNSGTDGLPIHGDYSKGNLNDLLRSNILRSPYFKLDLYEKKTYHEVMNEIDIHVGYVEPWTIGTHGVPSTLFCCLYKFMLMRLTLKQLFGLLKESNPYTR